MCGWNNNVELELIVLIIKVCRGRSQTGFIIEVKKHHEPIPPASRALTEQVVKVLVRVRVR